MLELSLPFWDKATALGTTCVTHVTHMKRVPVSQSVRLVMRSQAAATGAYLMAFAVSVFLRMQQTMEGCLVLPCYTFSSLPGRRTVRLTKSRTPTGTGVEYLNPQHYYILNSTSFPLDIRVRTHTLTVWDRTSECIASADTRPNVAVRVAKGGIEFERVAWLRAEAYYEVRSVSFVVDDNPCSEVSASWFPLRVTELALLYFS